MDHELVNQHIPVGSIRPHPLNYNRHSRGHVSDLRASLKQFGQVRSIVVQEDTTGGYLCVAGHGVWEAAQLEGLPTMRADIIPADWPQVKVLAYLAADNELARYSDPDLEQLARLTNTLRESDATLARLAAGSEEALTRLTELHQQLAEREAAETRAAHATQFLDDDAEDCADDDALDESSAYAGVSARAASPSAEGNPYVNLIFVADRVQRDFVLQTLAHVRDVYALETSVEAIVKLCELFEAEPDGAQEASC